MTSTPTGATRENMTERAAGTRRPRCWYLGFPDLATASDGVIALTAAEKDTAASAEAILGLHEAMEAPVPAADRIEIRVPPYRGKALVPVLGWLAAARLGQAGTEVSWYLDRQQGPDSVRKLLHGLGWDLDKDRQGRTVRLHGPAPAAVNPPPAPRHFLAKLGAATVELSADYGVFSPDGVDEGSAQLLDVALRHAPVETVADIGIGYGPLAVGLVVNDIARSAVGTDVDCIALWLAHRNAAANSVPLAVQCSPDPTSVPPTPLTVCNIPTHIDAAQTRRLMAGLVRRATHGTLLAVVHASLEARYTRYLAAAKLRVERHPGRAHVVLAATDPAR